MDEIIYTINKADANRIFEHLQQNDNNFILPLSSKVDISDYAMKIYEKAVTVEAWKKNDLVGLVAIYLNDTEKKIGYITNVSVDKNFGKRGIATALLNSCIAFCRQKEFFEIRLEVMQNNLNAIGLYHKFKFVEFETVIDTIKMKLCLQ